MEPLPLVWAAGGAVVMLWMVHAVGFRSGYIAIEDQEDQMDIQNEGPEMFLFLLDSLPFSLFFLSFYYYQMFFLFFFSLTFFM